MANHSTMHASKTVVAIGLALLLGLDATALARGSGHGHRSSGHHHSRSGHQGKSKRSKAARDAFMKSHPCPANNNTSGACPGYVVDHIKALKRGGADAPSNMQWQTIEEGKAKEVPLRRTVRGMASAQRTVRLSAMSSGRAMTDADPLTLVCQPKR